MSSLIAPTASAGRDQRARAAVRSDLRLMQRWYGRPIAVLPAPLRASRYGQPTALVIAASDGSVALGCTGSLGGRRLGSTPMRCGVEPAVLKNVMALATGLCAASGSAKMRERR